jgi:hypothetical protein
LRLISTLSVFYNIDETGSRTCPVADFGIGDFVAFVIDNTQHVRLVGKKV